MSGRICIQWHHACLCSSDLATQSSSSPGTTLPGLGVCDVEVFNILFYPWQSFVSGRLQGLPIWLAWEEPKLEPLG